MNRKLCKYLGISMIALLLVTGCEKVPKMKNGEDKVVSLKTGDISVDTLYNDMKERFALDNLLTLIDTSILNKEYKTTKEMKEEARSQYDQTVEQYYNGDENLLLQETWREMGLDTADEVIDYLILQKKRTMVFEDYSKKQITDEEINKYYDEKIFGDITAKHILITPDTKENATDQEKTDANNKALEEAKKVIEKLNKGEKWDDLAKEYSDDESNKDKGGELPTFVHNDMVKEFEDAAKELEKGKYTTEPVKTTYGYHIIFKTDQKDKPKLKEVKDDIIEDLAKTYQSENQNDYYKALDKIRKDNGMKIEDTKLQEQYDKYIKNNTK